MFGLFKTKPPMVKLDALDHPILGKLEPHEKLSGVLRSVVNMDGAEVEVLIVPDGGPLEATLRLATDAASVLSELDARCRKLIANDSLAGYNSDWRFGAEVQADGSTKSFEKPPFNEEKFTSMLTPSPPCARQSALLAPAPATAPTGLGQALRKSPATLRLPWALETLIASTTLPFTSCRKP